MAAVATTRVAPSRVLLVACFGAFLAFLDATIVNVAFPSIRESFPTTSIGEPVVGPQRLQHRLRGLPHRLRPPHRPARPPARVRRGRGAVHRGLGAVRRRALGGPAGRRPHRPGPRRGHARARLAGAGGRGVPRRAALARDRALGRVGRRRRRPRAADRWCAGGARRLALGLPHQPPVRPGRAVGGPQPARREPGAGPTDDAGPRRARRCSPAAWPLLNLGIIKGPDWGWTSPAVLGLLRAAAVAAGAVRAQLAAPPLAAARPRAAAHAVVQHRLRRHGGGRLRLLRLPAHQHPVAAVRLGVRRAARRPRAGARARVVAAIVAARLGPLADQHGYRRLRRARCPGVGRRLPLVPPAWSGSSRPSGPSGCPARSSAASASARPCRCSAAPPWPPSRAVATPPPRPSCPARARSAACSASRSSS